MGFIRQAVGTAFGGISSPVTVPAGAVSLLSVIAFGEYTDSVVGDRRPIRVAISTDLDQTYATLLSGDTVPAQSLICVSEQNFPEFPVSPGERILVAFQDSGSAVLWYRDDIQ